MLEELLALGRSGAEYDAWLIKIGEGDQFGSGFVAVNPNSKIPALMDRSGPTPIRVFESGAILVYLAEKFGAFLPTEAGARAECLSWLFWQMGSAPYLGGGFGHFYAYAPTKIEYAIDRFAMEVKRQLDVLDRRLAESEYLAGSDYTIADIAVWPWYGGLAKGRLYGAAEFLSVRSTRTSSAGPTPSPSGRPCSAGAWSTASSANHRASCTSATMPAISKRRRRTSLRLRASSLRPAAPRRRSCLLIGIRRSRLAARQSFRFTSRMPRYKLTIEYDGSGFSGWQRQENGPSIQQVLEAAFFALTGRRYLFTAPDAPTPACMRAAKSRMSISCGMERLAPAARRSTPISWGARSRS